MVQIVDIPQLGSEVVRQVAELRTLVPDWRADLSSPLRYSIEQQVQQLIANRTLLNATGQQLVVSDATGSDLDQLLGNFGMTREVGETDGEFRRRVPDQWAALSRETEPGLLRRIVQQTAAGDASMVRGANYAVTLYVQNAVYNTSTQALRDDVEAAMNSPDEKPWYSDFTVAAETRTAYTVTGTVSLEAGFVQSQVEQAVYQALDDALLAQRRLNRVPLLSPMIVAMHDVDGVSSVSLTVTPGTVLTATAMASTVYVGSRGALVFS